jgi:hypothetical protein
MRIAAGEEPEELSGFGEIAGSGIRHRLRRSLPISLPESNRWAMPLNRPRRHPNRDERRALRAGQIRTFADQYAGRAQKGVEPNDRRYREDVERLVKRMDPRELDALLRDDED